MEGGGPLAERVSPPTPPEPWEVPSHFQTIVPSGRLALGKVKGSGHKNKLRKGFEIVYRHIKDIKKKAGLSRNNGPPHPACPGHSDFSVPANTGVFAGGSGFVLFFHFDFLR